MSKLSLIFYLFSLVVIILFAVFSYLMTTVNPERSQAWRKQAEKDAEVNAYAENGAVNADVEWVNTERNSAVEAEASRKSMEFLEETPEWMTNSSAESFESSSVNASVERNPTPINGTIPPKKSKGRRSIKEQRKNKRGIVVMRIIGDEGKPRIEIVLHPKRSKGNKLKTYYNGNNFDKGTNQNNELVLNIMPDDSAVLENRNSIFERKLNSDNINITYLEMSERIKSTELIQNSILNIMPNNVAILENEHYSFKPILISDNLPSVMTSDKANTTEGVFELKSFWINPMNTPTDNEGFSSSTDGGNLNTELLAYTMKIMSTEATLTVDTPTIYNKNNSEEEKIKPYIYAIENNTNNILPFSIPVLETVTGI